MQIPPVAHQRDFTQAARSPSASWGRAHRGPNCEARAEHVRMLSGRRSGRKRARKISSGRSLLRSQLWLRPDSRRAPPREPAQIVQGGGPRGGTRGACAERRLLSRGRTPLSHLPDKHHENSAAHTVIAAPAAGRVSTSPFPRGESESEISPPPSSLRPPPAAGPAAPSRDSCRFRQRLAIPARSPL